MRPVSRAVPTPPGTGWDWQWQHGPTGDDARFLPPANGRCMLCGCEVIRLFRGTALEPRGRVRQPRNRDGTPHGPVCTWLRAQWRPGYHVADMPGSDEEV